MALNLALSVASSDGGSVAAWAPTPEVHRAAHRWRQGTGGVQRAQAGLHAALSAPSERSPDWRLVRCGLWRPGRSLWADSQLFRLVPRGLRLLRLRGEPTAGGLATRCCVGRGLGVGESPFRTKLN